MPRKKTAGKHRMPQLDFVDSPPLNTAWRPTTPSRSCLCPVTAEVVSTDEIGCDWISPQFEQLLAAGNKRVLRSRHVPLISDASTSVRTVPGRRAQFPPLQFVSEGVRTAVKPRITRSRVSKTVQSFASATDTTVAYLQPDCDEKVADNDLCSEHIEQQVQAEATDGAQLTKRQRITDPLIATHSECLTAADCTNSCTDELTSCSPVCVKPSHCTVVDDQAGYNHVTGGRILYVTNEDLAVAEKSPHSVVSQRQDLTVCAETTSGIQFDINTPTCEVESTACGEDLQEVVNHVETETETCQNASGRSIEPVRVLCFSHIDKSLDETEDPLERVICAAELNEHMSELLDGDVEASVNAHVNSCQSLVCDRPELFSTINASTPFENHSKHTILVSDTPLSDYGLSYRERLLKAANIRLRHRTHKS